VCSDFIAELFILGGAIQNRVVSTFRGWKLEDIFTEMRKLEKEGKGENCAV